MAPPCPHANRRVGVLASHLAPTPSDDVDSYRAELVRAHDAIVALLERVKCHPILIRLAWHDSGTFDASVPPSSWPAQGGANGSIRFDVELDHGANAGLEKAVRYLTEIRKAAALDKLTWADLIQLGSATAIEHAGGPKLRHRMRYGRLDVGGPSECPREGNLPDAYPEQTTPENHLRDVFHRMGFSDRDIVALSGAHTVGRAFKERSGTTPCGYGAKRGTKHTGLCPMHGSFDGSMLGGKSWTSNWLRFDNSYFKYETLAASEKKDLLWFATDHALVKDTAFRPHFERYAKDEQAFFQDFASAFLKLTELGSKFDSVICL